MRTFIYIFGDNVVKKKCEVLWCNNIATRKIQLTKVSTSEKVFKMVCNKHYKALKNHSALLFKGDL